MSKRQLPTSEHASPVDRALEKAVLALQMQRFEEAERVASQVLKSNRGSVLAACILGRALLAQKRADEAIDVLQRAARRSGDPEAETLFAVALAAAGRRSEAIEQLQRTTARRPPFPPAFIELGGQLSNAGRFDEGIELLERAVSRLRQIASI